MRLLMVALLLADVMSSTCAVSSVNGVLDVTLVMDVGVQRFPDGSMFRTRMYNGTVPGPMLRVLPGDLLKITVINNLQGDADGVRNTFRNPNTTNLHLHGLHVSPVLPGDDVSVAISPGGYRTYEYQIPRDHAPGLHWYHAHWHGSSALHVFGGAYGLIRVLGEEGIAGMLPTITMPVQYLHWTGEASCSLSGNSIPMISEKSQDAVLNKANRPVNDMFLMNGEVSPTYRLKQCKSTRLSIAFTSAGSQLNLTLTSPGCTPCSLQLISRDGHQLHKYPRPVEQGLFIPAGGRADVLARCTAVCNYTMSSDNAELAKVEVVGAAVCEPAITPLSISPIYRQPGYTRDLRSEVVEDANIVDMQLIDGTGCHFRTDSKVVGRRDSWFAMDHKEDVRHRMHLGTVHEVRLTGSLNHPFHLHITPFQIMSGTTVAGKGNFEIGDWADTVQFTDMVFRTRPVDFTGYQMFHCHVLSHEDQGCMAEMEIIPARRRHSLAGHFGFHPLLPVFLLLLVSGAIGVWTLFMAPARGYKSL